MRSELVLYTDAKGNGKMESRGERPMAGVEALGLLHWALLRLENLDRISAEEDRVRLELVKKGSSDGS